MTTTPNMLLVLPTDHGSADTWDVILDTLFTRVDSHNHSVGLGVKVPTGGLNIDADLSFSPSGTPRAITDLKAVDFAPVASSTVTSLAGALFISDGTGGLTANELYFRTTSGTNVKFTSGAALNVAAFAGGIGGDYSAISALLDYDDASDTYRLRQETASAVRQFAKVSCADLRLTEYKASGVTPVPPAAVTIKSPAALASSYSVTMPAALPGSTLLMQMDSAGVLTLSNTIGNTLTLPATVAGASNFTGALTMASTLGVTGLITATAGATAAANQSFTVSGTGRYKHPSTEMPIHIAAFQVDGASTYVTFNQVGYITGFGGACTVQAWVPLPVGKRILSYQQFYNVNSTGASITPKLRRMTIGTGAKNDVAAGVGDNTGAAVESQTIAASHTVLSGEGYFIEVSVSNAAHQVYGAIVLYDDP